jgi:cytochrome c-type biogenesis protein
MLLLVSSLVAGAVTVLAPCILPLLPVVLGGAAAETSSRLKPLRIVGFLGLSIFAFTFLLKASTALIAVPDSFWKSVSAIAVGGLGFSLLFPRVWARLSLKIPGLHGGNRLLATGYKKRASWAGDAAVGLALGPIFTTCSPTYFLILATVLPNSFALGALYVAAYVLGLAAALLAIALLGQRLVARLGGAANPEGWFKRSLGLVLLATALAILTGADKRIEAKILDAGYLNVPALEKGLAAWAGRYL